MKSLKIFVLIFLIIVGGGLVNAHGGVNDGDNFGMMSDFYGMGSFGWIFMVLIIVGLVWLIIWLVNQLQEPKRRKRK